MIFLIILISQTSDIATPRKPLHVSHNEKQLNEQDWAGKIDNDACVSYTLLVRDYETNDFFIVPNIIKNGNVYCIHDEALFEDYETIPQVYDLFIKACGVYVETDNQSNYDLYYAIWSIVKCEVFNHYCSRRTNKEHWDNVRRLVSD